MFISNPYVDLIFIRMMYRFLKMNFVADELIQILKNVMVLKK
jgi:hypothetical protein